MYMYMIDGILLIDKEEGITSYDVIRKLKKILGKGFKMGHAGTLDPFATGLLIILFGKATKMMETFHTYEKTYTVCGVFGIAIDTQDITGEVISKNETVVPKLEEINEIIEEKFIGNISQTPPAFSAKRVKGIRSYDLARKGESVELKPKDIFISNFEILSYEYPKFTLRISCSTGTYVRTLVNDLGISLNAFATAEKLRRISIGDFNVSEVVLSTDIVEGKKEDVLKRVINV
ncbi:MAG: tRNA pseudouridine synthase B [candidate division WS6 bacterium GW2011_GWF2_33_92]|nr:MAG: tRNA pseudouridine synthase B [candidate division WS6 bacterium GW2011_GWF2_33_92]